MTALIMSIEMIEMIEMSCVLALPGNASGRKR